MVRIAGGIARILDTLRKLDALALGILGIEPHLDEETRLNWVVLDRPEPNGVRQWHAESVTWTDTEQPLDTEACDWFALRLAQHLLPRKRAPERTASEKAERAAAALVFQSTPWLRSHSASRCGSRRTICR